MSGKVIDVERLIENKPFGRFHVQIVVLCFLMMLIDGFDISIGAFAGPGLLKQFGISHATLGAFFSAALFAGLVGTPFFGMLADRYGRKKIITWGAIFFGIFTWASVIAANFQQMIVLRFIASMGVAGIMPICVALASEFAPRHIRARMVTCMFVGATLGGVVSGLVSVRFTSVYGWQILFWISGVVPILLAFVLMAWLPESLHYLIRRNLHRDRIVKTLRWMEPTLAVDENDTFVVSEYKKHEVRVSALFAGRLAILTPLIWAANVCSLLVFYFANSWLPITLGSSSLGTANAAIATTLFIIGGSVGGVTVSLPLDKFGFLPVPILFACAIPALIAIGTPGLAPGALLAIIILAGFLLYGVQYGLIAMEGPLFPPPVRGRGVGFCFAIARLGAMIGPAVGGVLISQHMPLQKMFFFFAIPLAVGCVITAIITPLYRRQVLDAQQAVGEAEIVRVASSAVP
ncbi:MAG TPA: MFS transporter [Stellaceae bacterium]|jgi:AAHS family 4-hydroxybenzoate transporter-like MFS transporter|nr:MFS transporter [Stellaceae bacterium]